MGRLAEFSPVAKGEFSIVYQQAKKWHCEAAVVYYLAGKEKKFGVIASKKIGNAVKRNRAKRVARAAFLSLKDDLKFGTYVIITRVNINDMDFSSVVKSLRWSFKRLEAMK